MLVGMVLAIDSTEKERPVIHSKLQWAKERDLRASPDIPCVIRFAASIVEQLNVETAANGPVDPEA